MIDFITVQNIYKVKELEYDIAYLILYRNHRYFIK